MRHVSFEINNYLLTYTYLLNNNNNNNNNNITFIRFGSQEGWITTNIQTYTELVNR